MFKKLFLLWEKHPVGSCRLLFALLIPTVLWPTFAMIYADFLLWFIILCVVGEKEKWDKEW